MNTYNSYKNVVSYAPFQSSYLTSDSSSYTCQHLPGDNITHVIYYSGTMSASTGQFTIECAHYFFPDLDDSSEDFERNLQGDLKQLFLQKKRNRNLKTILEISEVELFVDGPGNASTEAGVKLFASGAVQLLKDYGFDGLEIGIPLLRSDDDVRNFVLVLKEMREQLDRYGEKMNYHFLLCLLTCAEDARWKKLPWDEITSYVDFINMMPYDYACNKHFGYATHRSSLHRSSANQNSTPFSTDEYIQYFIDQKVPPRKLISGISLFARDFTNTRGPGCPLEDSRGRLEGKKIWSYKDLPRPGFEVEYDAEIGASWAYSRGARIMTSYDTPEMVQGKAEYIDKHHLGGCMWWDCTADKSGEESLVRTFWNQLGGGRFEKSQNCLSYPDSKYDNLRAGMPRSGYSKI